MVEDTLTPVRQEVLQFVRSRPGATIRDVAVRLAVSHSTATYHLLALQRLGVLSQQRVGREMRHFAGGQPPGPGERLRSFLEDPRTTALVDVLVRDGVERLTMNQVAHEAGVPFGYAKRTLRHLQDMGFVTLERRNYRYTIRVLAPLREASQARA